MTSPDICCAVDYQIREEPEHKVERNLLKGNAQNLFESHDSVKDQSSHGLPHAKSSGSQSQS